MKKLYLDHLYYPKDKIYSLALTLGRRLTNYLGKEGFQLLLDSRLLLTGTEKDLAYISDETYKLHPAAKALEFFLKKVATGQNLKDTSEENLGKTFSYDNSKLRKKIKDPKLILKTKATWEFCRNDIMHYKKKKRLYTSDIFKKYDDITDLMVELFTDFYGKTELDDEIRKGFDQYATNKRTRFNNRKLLVKKTSKLFPNTKKMKNKFEILLFETKRKEKPVESFILSQNPSTKAKIARQIDLLEDYGNLLGMPHSKKLQNNLYELRIRGKNELRILYTFKRNKIYLLHIFKKQTQKTPSKELKTATLRIKEI